MDNFAFTVTPITVEIGGVQRELRATRAVRRRAQAAKAEGKDAGDILVDVLFGMLHDMNGAPPVDIPSVDVLERLLPVGDDVQLNAAVLCAFSQGKQTKKQIEELLAKALAATQTGSVTGPSAPSSSESVQ